MSLGPAYVADISGLSFGEYVTTFDASGGSFPTTLHQGDWFNTTVAGTVDGQAFVIGDILIALVDSPSTTTFAANWSIVPTISSLPDPIQLSNGSAGAPSYSFSGDPDTGVYNVSADILGLTAGGVQVAKLTEASGLVQFIVPQQNNAGVPSFAFGDGNTGFYEASDNVLQISIAGFAKWQIESNNFSGLDSQAPRLINAAASATVPNIMPSRSDLNTGIGHGTGDNISLIAGGVEGIRLAELNNAIKITIQTVVGITAFAGGGQGSATQLQGSYSVISTVATTGDSVKLPAVLKGTQAHVKNDGANAMDVFPLSGDDLGAGTNTAVSVAAGASAIFIGTVDNTTWTQLLGGVPDPLLLGDGTALLPAYSFTSDPDTGIYLAAVNELGFSTGGVLKATLTAAGRLGIGTPTPNGPLEVVGAQPGNVGGHSAGIMQIRSTATTEFASVSITGHSSFNTNTQLWFFGSLSGSNDDIGLVNRQNAKLGLWTNNVPRLEITAAGVVQPLVKIENAVGTAALPSYSFAGDPDLGIFRVSADRIGISSNGALRWDVSANFITTTLNTRGPDSTALLPTYSFASDPDTGVFNVSADILGIAAGGVQIAQAKEVVGANQFIVAPGVIQNNPAAPSLAFGDGDTGFFESADDNLIVATLGIDRFFWTGNVYGGLIGTSAGVLNEAASGTNPTLVPNRSDDDTGIGQATLDQLNLIAGGLTCMSISETAGARQIGFYDGSPISLQTGVAVTTAAVHAALVALRLITA